MVFSGIQSFQFSKILASPPPSPNHINIPTPLINDNLKYKMLEKITNESCQARWIDIHAITKKYKHDWWR